GIAVATNNLADTYLRLIPKSKTTLSPTDLAEPYKMIQLGLNTVQKMASPAWMLGFVEIFSRVKIRQGDLKRGLVLTGLIYHHPAFSADIVEISLDDFILRIQTEF